MTIAVDLGRKATKQTIKQKYATGDVILLFVAVLEDRKLTNNFQF